MHSNEKCFNRTRKKIIVFKDGKAKSSVTFRNKDQKLVTEIDIDGCVVPKNSPTRCCDFGLRDGKKIWLIELKGNKSAYAATQIVSAYKNTQICTSSCEIIPVIITSKSPAISGQQKLITNLKKSLKGQMVDVIISTRHYDVDV